MSNKTVLSIDIGLRNLSMCIMSTPNESGIDPLSSLQIHLWDVYNTLDSDDYRCKGIQKNGKVCGKKCTFKYRSDTEWIYTCKPHFPKNIGIKKDNHFKKKNVKEYLLQTIADVVLLKLEEIYNKNSDEFKSVTNILIELQPKLNNSMKFVSHIIYGKLVELYRGTKCSIRFVRASQKLKCYTGPEIKCKLKGAYAQRKWLSIEYCKWFLENKFSEEQKNQWLQFFLSHSKADDVSDTFLMAINALVGIPKTRFKHRNGNELK
jgi:hypothetical protein